MIDLNQIVEHFLDEAVRLCRDDGGKQDDEIIAALNDRNQSTEARRNEVLKWLGYYRTLQGLNQVDRDAAAGEIVEFADARVPVVGSLSEAEIVDRFTSLHDRCGQAVRPKMDKTPRDLTSLTSKALWCCYPDAIPMYDSNARRALGVLSRLMGLDRPADGTPYTRFVSVWLNLYRRVERTIDDDRLGGYCYKVRVFDRILWIIGEPD